MAGAAEDVKNGGGARGGADGLERDPLGEDREHRVDRVREVGFADLEDDRVDALRERLWAVLKKCVEVVDEFDRRSLPQKSGDDRGDGERLGEQWGERQEGRHPPVALEQPPLDERDQQRDEQARADVADDARHDGAAKPAGAEALVARAAEHREHKIPLREYPLIVEEAERRVLEEAAEQRERREDDVAGDPLENIADQLPGADPRASGAVERDHRRDVDERNDGVVELYDRIVELRGLAVGAPIAFEIGRKLPANVIGVELGEVKQQHPLELGVEGVRGLRDGAEAGDEVRLCENLLEVDAEVVVLRLDLVPRHPLAVLA